MHETPLPLDEQELRRIVDLFRREDLNEIEILWWWEPFHRTGFEALRFAVDHVFSEGLLEDILDNMSVVSAPERLRPSLAALAGLDNEFRIKSLDPSIRVRKTLEASGGSWRKKFVPGTFILSIETLSDAVRTSSNLWQPNVGKLAEWRVVSNWLTPQPSLLKRFQRLSSWRQLAIIERLSGSIISSSKLEFQRVYTNDETCYT